MNLRKIVPNGTPKTQRTKPEQPDETVLSALSPPLNSLDAAFELDEFLLDRDPFRHCFPCLNFRKKRNKT